MAAFNFSFKQGLKDLTSPFTNLFKKPATPLFTPAPKPTATPLFTPAPKAPAIPSLNYTPAPGMAPNASTPQGPRYFAPSVLPQVKPQPQAAAAPPVAPPRPAGAPAAVVPPPAPVAPPAQPTTPPSSAAVPPPAPFTPNPAQQKTLQEAETTYQKSLQLSPEELTTQEDLDRLSESARRSYTNTRDQAIPLEFITGQLASIERRALDLAEPLERKLARLQAARTSSTEASKFALERADKEIVGARGEAKDIRTETESARRFGVEEAGRVATRTQADRQFEEDKRQFGLDYAIKQRETTLKEAEAKGKTEVSAYQQRQAEKTNSAIDDLLPRVNNKTVGVGSYAGFIRGTEAKDFAADLEFLKSSIGFGALQEMREASKTGGALGQVSDRELSLLTSALGGLDVGQTPENFKKNLNRIKESVNRWNQAVGGASNTYKAPSGNTYNLPY